MRLFRPQVPMPCGSRRRSLQVTCVSLLTASTHAVWIRTTIAATSLCVSSDRKYPCRVDQDDDCFQLTCVSLLTASAHAVWIRTTIALITCVSLLTASTHAVWIRTTSALTNLCVSSDRKCPCRVDQDDDCFKL